MIPATFKVPVAGIGEFTFRRRTVRDQPGIEAEADRILGGPVSDRAIERAALAIATLSRLTVQAPEGWELDAIDPLDEAAVRGMFEVHKELRAAEERFRGRAGADGAAVGTGAG